MMIRTLFTAVSPPACLTCAISSARSTARRSADDATNSAAQASSATLASASMSSINSAAGCAHVAAGKCARNTGKPGKNDFARLEITLNAF
jgi:hypothetical protein